MDFLNRYETYKMLSFLKRYFGNLFKIIIWSTGHRKTAKAPSIKPQKGMIKWEGAGTGDSCEKLR